MKTKEKKIKELERIENLLDESKDLIFFEFEKIPVSDFQKVRSKLKDKGTIKMIKKTLLKIGLNKKGINDFNPLDYKTQISTIFVNEDLPYNVSLLNGADFKKNLKILGIYNNQSKKFIADEEIIKILAGGSMENILSKLVFLISSPLRKLLYVLKERSKNLTTKG